MKVYYVNGYADEVYYVYAENEKSAEEILRKEISKHIFKAKLEGKEIILNVPPMLGKNVIVEFGISKETLDTELEFMDITASAYIFSQNGLDNWASWDITTEDVIGNKDIAKAVSAFLSPEKDKNNEL